MIRFPWTARSRPLSPAECPQRMRDLRFQQLECREKLKKVGRVAVVGGGFAGLMAARRLVQHGIKVTVFEARKEVGGRVLSNRNFSAGRITEEGAELIGSFHTKWLELAREFGLAMISRMDPDLYERECLDVRLKLEKDKFLSMKEFWELTTAMNDRVLMPLAELAKTKIDDPSRPWLQPNLQTYDNMSAAQAFENIYKVPRNTLLWKMLQFKLENDEVAPLDEMNFLGLLRKVRAGQGKRCVEDDKIRRSSSCILDGYWDELEIFRCADGCQTLAKKMAKQIQTPKKKGDPKPAEVLPLLAVRRIHLSGKGAELSVKATREDGRFVDDKPPKLFAVFSYVILAIPPSVWDGVTITAEGKDGKPKDADPAKEIGQMRMNDAVKYFSDVKERFWIKEKPEKPDPNRDRGSAPYGGSLQIGQIWEGTDNQTRVDEKQGIVLSVFAGPISSGHAPTRKDFEIGLQDLYRGYTGNYNTRFANWPKLPFIKTGYWTPYLKEIFIVGKKLTDPYHDRLFFAGEHTQMDFFGYMEGALRSGERAAETLMLHACGLVEEKPAPKSPSRPPQKPAPEPPTPTIVARATPLRENAAFEREVGTPFNKRASGDAGEAESPFLDQNLFAAGVEEEWEPRVAALVAESPFVGALEERGSGLDRDQWQEEEAPDKLDGEEELEAAEVWEKLEEDELTPQVAREEDESLDDQEALIREDETKLESPEDSEGERSEDSENLEFESAMAEDEADDYEADFDLLHPRISTFQLERAAQEPEALEIGENQEADQAENSGMIQHDIPKTSTLVKVVGQRVELDLNDIEFARDAGDIRWTIPGTAVLNYVGNAKNAKLFKLTDAAFNDRPKIAFFWVDAADGRSVRARFRLKSGGLGQVVFDFDVKGPTVSHFTGETNVTRIERRSGLTAMRFGKLIEAPGITWKWKITMPLGHAGYIKDVQTVLNDRSQIWKDTRKSVWRHPSRTHPHVQLDGHEDGEAIYTSALVEEKRGAGSSFNNRGISDSPHSGLPPLAKIVSVNDQFTYYIMFKPAADKAQDAIWVPVAKAKWFWKATATQRDKKWILSQPKPKMEASITKATVDFPMYETNASENEWQEVSR